MNPASDEGRPRRRIAIVGTGIAGLTAAHLLRRRHQVTLFEAADYAGGHTHTVDVPGGPAVDTGFIVFNPGSYPNFVRLLEQLGIDAQPASMTFSVSSRRSGLEYGAGGTQRLFAQRRNLLRPAFYGMLAEIARFYRRAPELLEAGGDDTTTLGEYLDREGYSTRFVEDHLVPFGAAIWSASLDDMRSFPARFFVQFFQNHGFLRLRKPQWRVVRGGSREYVRRLLEPLAGAVRLRTPVAGIRRRDDGVDLRTASGWQTFDEVVLALHSDQALRLLDDPSPAERSVLGAIGYQENRVLLHTDTRLLPQRRRAWSSWNYRIPETAAERVTVTYNMNLLQSLAGDDTYCVTLNETDQVDPARVLEEFTYHHPRYTLDAVAAQRRRGEICGVNRTHYCGAYWGYGFHEDGVVSALEVTQRFGETL